MDDSSDQSQTTTQDTTDTTQPVAPSEQPPTETPQETQPTSEQPTNPVSSETQPVQTSPKPPTSPNPEPAVNQPQQPESQPIEIPQPTQPETPALNETQSQPEETPPVAPATETSTETQPPVSSPVINIPALHYPFSGNIPVTFTFGAQSDNEDIKKKFTEWGIVGHNGLDFGMSFGTEVFSCDSGKVVQSGDNGDFGISITIQHPWGQSVYAHLSETKVKVDDEIQPNKVIGLSGSSGAAFGEHLHFAIKPNNQNTNNGYLGFIDPAPYLSLPSQKEETKQEPTIPPEQPSQEVKLPETPQQPIQDQPKPKETQQPQPPVEEVPPINYGPENPVEPTQPKETEQPQNPQTPQSTDEEIQKQVDEKLKVELDARRQKANEARAKKKEDNLTKIFNLVQTKRVVTNDEVRDFLHVSQSTATNYLTEMVNRGMLKKEGIRGGAKYSI